MNTPTRIAGVLATVAIAAIGCTLPEDNAEPQQRHDVSAGQTSHGDKAKADQPEGRMETATEANARATAESYLDMGGFSRESLIDQLKYEGFSTKAATYGADAAGADWREQAVMSAESYLNTSAFSRAGLIDQLKYEGFTQAQAEHGVSVAYR